MQVHFICFVLIATVVLGGLCLLVLEYENGKARWWNRLWIDHLPYRRTRPTGEPEPVFTSDD